MTAFTIGFLADVVGARPPGVESLGEDREGVLEVRFDGDALLDRRFDNIRHVTPPPPPPA